MDGVLGDGSSRLRDGALFLLAAALPALAVGLLGLRALRNEEAALRRELTLLAETAALAEQRRFEASLAALESGRVGGTPPWAEPVRIDASLKTETAPEEGAARQAASAGSTSDCRDQAAELSRAEGRAWTEIARAILTDCEQARSSRGRWLWPVVALDPRVTVTGERLEAWLERHGDRLDHVEREVIRREIDQASRFDEATRTSLALAIAQLPQTRAEALVAPHRRAMRAGRSLIRWRDAQSVGRLERRDDGSYVGFIVHAGSLTAAMADGWPNLPDDLEARVARGSSDLAADLPIHHEVPLFGSLRLAVGHPHPERVARRSKLLLGTAAGGASLIAVALAGLLFARMRRARRLSALRTDFVAAVSHELRTPLASLRMLAELLAEDRVDEGERAEIHQALAGEAQRLGRTVDRLLGFSRMEAGKLRLAREPVDLVTLAEESITTFEARHPERRPVERRFASSEMVIAGDPAALGMVFDNLLGNARKYAPEGEPYEIGLRRERGGVRVTVRDHGPGIAKRHQRRVFRPFERADDRLSEATEGSGIGLSLVSHVVRGHGGTVSVDSAPGAGATFVVWLPEGDTSEHGGATS